VKRVNPRAVFALLVLCAAASSGVAAQSMQTKSMQAPAFAHSRPPVGTSVTRALHHIVTIGSAVDAGNGDQNPYGLAIAPVTAGKMKAGDLVICNFNDNLNIQGLGTTIEVLHPTPGSKPQRLARNGTLTGCNALALSPGDNPWVAASTANDEPVLSPGGKVIVSLSGSPYAQPWGQAFSGTAGPSGVAAFYVGNSNDGSLVRINITSGSFVPQVIATGFSVNHGVPGTNLSPAGLTYDASIDTLYIVDSNANRVVAFKNVTMIPPNGVIVQGSGFGGPSGSQARVVLNGAPLASPISSALLYNGHIVVGNTSNNLLFEIDPTTGHVVNTTNLDKGNPGALFGIAASGTSATTTKIYFNDDNDNTVKVLQK
jgi:hypothetical protein